MVASGTWSQSFPVQTSQDHMIYSAGPTVQWVTFDIKGPKAAISAHITPTFSQQASREEAYNSDMPTDKAH